MREFRFVITAAEDGMRVGDYLKRLHAFSTRTLVALKQSPRGLLLCRAQTCLFTHVRTIDPLYAGDTLAVTLEEKEKDVTPSARKVAILYEDDDLLVYDKPPGMPCHTSCGHAVDTLENVFAAHCLRADVYAPLRALNRLDRDTSGCVLVAKNQFAASRLTGHAEKAYRALVVGEVRGDGRVDARIFRPDPVDMRRVVDERGQVAMTDYGILHTGVGHTFLQFTLHTGRTHQIRVHMAHIGYPVLGDTLYGTESAYIGRQALHCANMNFTHPVTGTSIRVFAPLPTDIKQAGVQTGCIREEREPCES